MEDTVVVVSGCKKCPFRIYDKEWETYDCFHPEYKGTVSNVNGGLMFEFCPLKQSNFKLELKERK